MKIGIFVAPQKAFRVKTNRKLDIHHALIKGEGGVVGKAYRCKLFELPFCGELARIVICHIEEKDATQQRCAYTWLR
jgi:hypothetical protein